MGLEIGGRIFVIPKVAHADDEGTRSGQPSILGDARDLIAAWRWWRRRWIVDGHYYLRLRRHPLTPRGEKVRRRLRWVHDDRTRRRYTASALRRRTKLHIVGVADQAPRQRARLTAVDGRRIRGERRNLRGATAPGRTLHRHGDGKLDFIRPANADDKVRRRLGRIHLLRTGCADADTIAIGVLQKRRVRIADQPPE